MSKSSWLTLVVYSVVTAIAAWATCTPSQAAMPHPIPHPIPHPFPHPKPHPKPHPMPHPKPHPMPHPKPHPKPHPSHHHHGWNPYPIPYRPVVVVRTPVYPVVSESAVTTYAVTPSNPVPASISVAVLNPTETGATLGFTIGGEQYNLSPGLRQDFQLAGPQAIQFDRGGSFGTASYPLSEGLYKFKATEAGWDLERLPYEPAASQ
jgi:hypothetical protein